MTIYVQKVSQGCQLNLVILEYWLPGNTIFFGQVMESSQCMRCFFVYLFVLFYLLYPHAICLVSCPNMGIIKYRVQVENISSKILLTVSTSARPKFYYPFRLRRRSRKAFLSIFGTLYIYIYNTYIYIYIYTFIYIYTWTFACHLILSLSLFNTRCQFRQLNGNPVVILYSNALSSYPLYISVDACFCAASLILMR